MFAVSPADGERLLREQPVPGITSPDRRDRGNGYWLERGGNGRALEPRGLRARLA